MIGLGVEVTVRLKVTCPIPPLTIGVEVTVRLKAPALRRMKLVIVTSRAVHFSFASPHTYG